MVVLIALGLLLLAGCGREYDSPYVPTSPEYAGYAWARDFDGDGVADSVEKYAPGCQGVPKECLDLARDRYLTLAGTPPPAPGPIRVGSITVSDMTLLEGETRPVQVVVLPADATRPEYEMGSQNGEVAMVTSGGIYAAGKGTTIVTVHALDGSDVRAQFLVTVNAQPERVFPVDGVAAQDMVFSLLTLGEPLRKKPVITWKPSNATDKDYTLTSENPRLARIVGDSVEATGALGKTIVTLRTHDGGLETSFQVEVTLLE